MHLVWRPQGCLHNAEAVVCVSQELRECSRRVLQVDVHTSTEECKGGVKKVALWLSSPFALSQVQSHLSRVLTVPVAVFVTLVQVTVGINVESFTPAYLCAVSWGTAMRSLKHEHLGVQLGNSMQRPAVWPGIAQSLAACASLIRPKRNVVALPGNGAVCDARCQRA